MEVERSIDTKAHLTWSYKSLSSFMTQDKVKAGINTIWQGGLPIDFLVGTSKSQTLVVVLNGAITPGSRLPWLSGTGVTQGMNVSRLFISDPTLYLGQGLTSAYYAGNMCQPHLQRDLVKIISKTARSLNAQKIVFLGGSSGGFASLALSKRFPGSTAVVFNPQTNLKVHSPLPVKKWLSVAWNRSRLTQLPEEVDYDLISLYASSFENRVIYLQNRTDSHYRVHFVPFLANIGVGELQYMVHDRAQGHIPPPKEMIRNVLNLACSKNLKEQLDGFTLRQS